MQNSKDSNCKYRSVLVPLDGSESAEHALPMALSLARRHGAALHVARVFVPVAGVAGEHAVRYDAAMDRELMKRAQDYLDDVVARLEGAGGVRATTALLDGPVGGMISRHAATVGADLLVMTTQGRGPMARFWLGSVSDELVRQAGIPILFVRPRSTPPNFANEPGIQRVSIPLDGSPLAERVLEPVLALDAAMQREYTLLRVIMPMTDLNYGPAGGAITGYPEALKQLQELEQAETGLAGQYLEQLASRLRARSFTVSTRVLLNFRPAIAILEDASSHGADLIALATHGRGGLKRLMLGSVADKVLRGAETPVLVYRPVDDSAPMEQ